MNNGYQLIVYTYRIKGQVLFAYQSITKMESLYPVLY